MKSDFYIDRVGKEEIKELLYTHHYLKDESKDFKSGFNYGLSSVQSGNVLLGLATALVLAFLLVSQFQKLP
jgi:hypothetical protein